MTVALQPMELLGFSTVLSCAHRSGLSRALVGTPATAAQLAERLGLAERPVQLVLELLAVFGVVEREGDAWSAGAALRQFQALAPGGLELDASIWSHLPQWLSDGSALMADEARPAIYAGIAGGLGVAWAQPARELAEQLGPAGRVLDLGCGSGVWSLALAERDPTAHVTGLDFPPVLDVFRARAAELGLGARIGVLAGDAHALPVPPRSADTLVLANVLRLDGAERARSLVQRWAAAVVPGGRAVVVDALAGGDLAAERARALYTVHLALRSAQGRVHAPATVARWLGEAGFEVERHVAFGSAAVGALGAIVARMR